MGGGPVTHTDDKVLVLLPYDEPTEALRRLRDNFPGIEVKFVKATSKPMPDDSDVTITTSSGIHGPQIAEWVIMTALVASHRYNRTYEAQKRKDWKDGTWADDENLAVRDMVKQRIGILGYGSIGRQVGRVAKAMGMDVLAYTASPRTTPESRHDNGFIVPETGDPDGTIPIAWFSGLKKEDYHEFFKQDLDMLVICIPLTEQTRHLLSGPEFEILSKRKTFVSNISCGGIIDQPALVAALHAGEIRGAALDVTDPEPLPPTDPLWDAPNVIISPHISGITVEYYGRALQVLEENLRREASGRKRCNVIDRKRGY